MSEGMSPEEVKMFQARVRVINDIQAERSRQETLWGVQRHANGTGSEADKLEAADAKMAYDNAVALDRLSWRHILDEEVKEAFAESDWQRLRAELVQVAAVAVAWIEDIDHTQDVIACDPVGYPM